MINLGLALWILYSIYILYQYGISGLVLGLVFLHWIVLRRIPRMLGYTPLPMTSAMVRRTMNIFCGQRLKNWYILRMPEDFTEEDYLLWIKAKIS
jgi:hypothetical protein